MEGEKPKLVVSLDIGSTYSGYAWQWRNGYGVHPGNVEMNTHWECAPVQIIKTKTCILIGEQDNRIMAIGHRAEKRYTQEMEKGNSPNILFKDFKLLLYEKNFNKNIESVSGVRLPFFEVMSKFIEGLKNHFLDNLKKKGLDMKTIMWVLTVPAIWSLESRDFMRQAAEHGGLDGKSLKIALEPEVAAIYCLNLPLEEKKILGNIGDVGQHFLTADLGGGTSDFTAIKVKENGEFDIIYKAQGSLIGGQNINDAFFQALHDSFKGELWETVFKNQDEVLALHDDFEQNKVNLTSPKSDDCFISLKIPAEFRDGLNKKLITMKQEAKEKGLFTVKRDKLLFDPAYVKDNFFKETASRITHEMQKLLEKPELENVNIVVLVGGLSESNITVSQIKENIAESIPKVKVVVPTSPFRAILVGAVLYGFDQKIITSRKSPATFGIKTNRVFNSASHKEENIEFTDTGEAYCKDVFSIHIRQEEFVVVKEKQPEMTYFPMIANQTEARLEVFMHTANGNMLDKSKVLYTTDKECRKLGELIVKMPDTTDGTKRKISVSLTYGAEIEVRATDVTSGESFEVKLEYLNKYESMGTK